MVSGRAVWCKFKNFTDEQRQGFAGILKEDPAIMEEYFSAIEPHMLNYEMGSSMELDEPPEASEARKNLFSRIAKHSKGLYLALYELDPLGSEFELEQLIIKSRFPETDIHELKAPLMYLHAVSAHAASNSTRKEPGRPRDIVSYHYIWICIHEYKRVFGRMPPYSKGTKFQNFLKAVSGVVTRPQAALRGNITKRIDAAINFMSDKS